MSQTEAAVAANKSDNRPLTFRMAAWHGFAFSLTFLVYGAVKVVLAILDRNYQDIAQPMMFAMFGLVLISFAYAYKGLKSWGWYGLMVLNVLVIIRTLFDIGQYESAVLFLLSAGALYALLSPSTRDYLSGSR